MADTEIIRWMRDAKKVTIVKRINTSTASHTSPFCLSAFAARLTYLSAWSSVLEYRTDPCLLGSVQEVPYLFNESSVFL